MGTKLGKLLRGWSGLLGVPALIIALLIAGVIVIAHEFFGEPVPLDVAIRKDLQDSEKDASQPAASAVHSTESE